LIASSQTRDLFDFNAASSIGPCSQPRTGGFGAGQPTGEVSADFDGLSSRLLATKVRIESRNALESVERKSQSRGQGFQLFGWEPPLFLL
jgi:hypothetical protein